MASFEAKHTVKKRETFEDKLALVSTAVDKSKEEKESAHEKTCFVKWEEFEDEWEAPNKDKRLRRSSEVAGVSAVCDEKCCRQGLAGVPRGCFAQGVQRIGQDYK